MNSTASRRTVSRTKADAEDLAPQGPRSAGTRQWLVDTTTGNHYGKRPRYHLLDHLWRAGRLGGQPDRGDQPRAGVAREHHRRHHQRLAGGLSVQPTHRAGGPISTGTWAVSS